METKFNFKSQICTSREQSERLLALGVKPETADMSIICKYVGCDDDGVLIYEENIYPYPPSNERISPAWSLHRLIEMMPKNIAIDGDTAYPLQIQKRYDGQWCVGYQGWYDCVGDLYDSIIWIYQLLISEDYLDEFCNKG